MPDIISNAILESALDVALGEYEPSEIIRVLAEVIRRRNEYDKTVSRALIKVAEQLEDEGV